MYQEEIPAYILVDVETAGPNPGLYSLLSIGACTLISPRRTFYIELQPTSEEFTDEALSVHRLSMEDLKTNGIPAREALELFEAWLVETVPAGIKPIFVAFNAPFDWMFVSDYFHRFLGRNPFGHNALDIKAFYMGYHRLLWRQASLRDASHHYLEARQLTHHALQDALDQADLFEKMLAEIDFEKLPIHE